MNLEELAAIEGEYPFLGTLLFGFWGLKPAQIKSITSKKLTSFFLRLAFPPEYSMCHAVAAVRKDQQVDGSPYKIIWPNPEETILQALIRERWVDANWFIVVLRAGSQFSVEVYVTDRRLMKKEVLKFLGLS